MVLYADDTGIVITVSNKLDFNININQMFQAINTWFNVSLLTVNFSKTQYLELRIIVMLILRLIMVRNL